MDLNTLLHIDLCVFPLQLTVTNVANHVQTFAHSTLELIWALCYHAELLVHAWLLLLHAGTKRQWQVNAAQRPRTAPGPENSCQRRADAERQTLQHRCPTPTNASSCIAVLSPQLQGALLML